ncbi:very-long-chain 3-oxoacyl-CoA reductase 1-like [Juglans microcarpa x Juglans regia]|uniref:very-long-chain 3-oxoacyl-CoA reductase 1-like n=1 Tax=Juglans microcarpa x Juglans regia TaxID=2249226 RepID=UPI001B7EB8F6|nr:very-long-chain 3-oxoacyl-CoA reductase 1-like [Juglans microcarpa x Juglans regia]
MIFSRSAMELQDFILIVACSLGFISLCKTFIRFLKWVWVSFFSPAKNLNEYGSWALVTGSTDGIGKALALELASKGINLVLVGRNPSKLEATSNEIRERFARKVDVKDIVIDLAKFSVEEISNMVEEGIKGLDVGILINNAGMGPDPYPMFIHEVESEVLESLMRVNMDAATWVTRAVLPGMLQKKKGAIVNLVLAPPWYLAMFSRCIGLEYEEHGIDVQCQEAVYIPKQRKGEKKGLKKKRRKEMKAIRLSLGLLLSVQGDKIGFGRLCVFLAVCFGHKATNIFRKDFG